MVMTNPGVSPRTDRATRKANNQQKRKEKEKMQISLNKTSNRQRKRLAQTVTVAHTHTHARAMSFAMHYPVGGFKSVENRVRKMDKWMVQYTASSK